MRLISYCEKGRPDTTRWGLWKPEEGYVLDAQQAALTCLPGQTLPTSLRAVVEENDRVLPLLHQLQDKDTAKMCPECRVALTNIALRAPYTDPPRNILCTGINYGEHLKELDRPLLAEQKIPEHPFIFTKPRTAIAHPDTAVDGHAAESAAYDYEVELAVIIGKTGKNIPPEKALEHVFGYAIINDMSARDLQRITTQWYRGKALDESAPFGPCIVCKESLPEPQNLRITSRINGETRQDSHTSLMLFPVSTLIHVMSQGATLEAGDIIATGTPAGVGMSFKPPKFLKSGDVMELEIEGIGILHNTIR